ncbi:MAG: fluoride efflux transporter CrcB [Dehalococcoides mccartyi]|uniref:Fluoride-specific ion channel FluC n=1 Tax=Dehalococcoides mccartyi TaxID=61435 RepID=A0A0V8M528_9CHLR|nr:fluoride efflux transporter CrcB [Dehalococcoides mccartyi]AII60013.1 camphor resistance protein CrcB [Dehalococcoides mccartyi CG4]AQU03678.1 camphor resistance protein CrcB [Dehalococcoides mccartyi]AQU04978.1 camphor resistance protein CrcB [Dehalococcoides mccartyi]KSV18872.1 camphor resistance protein CrcB [Dehalococcoides mccartyi]MBF4482089.1 fluoride efflux transporter CrcB [Dehalococcoides mccartyi]
MREILYIAVAGGLGALGRYSISGLAQRVFGDAFPYGTLVVNILGSFLLGFVMQASMNTDLFPRNLRLAVTIGFLGAFTTFSTFSYETLGYIEDGAWLTAGLNILTNVVPGIIAVFLGILLGRTLFGGA